METSQGIFSGLDEVKEGVADDMYPWEDLSSLASGTAARSAAAAAVCATAVVHSVGPQTESIGYSPGARRTVDGRPSTPA